MAEENAVEEKGGKSKMTMILLGLVILLLLGLGGAGYFMYSKGVFDDKPVNQQGVAPTQEAQQQVAPVDVGETFLAKIDSLVLNITDAKGRAKLMKLSFTMKSTEPTIEALVEANKAEMIDSVIRQISARSSEELLTVGGKAMLKEEMIDELNNILNDATNGDEDIAKNMILDIFYTSFVIK